MQNWGRFGNEKDFIEWITKIVLATKFLETMKLQKQIEELRKQVNELNNLIYRNDEEVAGASEATIK